MLFKKAREEKERKEGDIKKEKRRKRDISLESEWLGKRMNLWGEWEGLRELCNGMLIAHVSLIVEECLE